MYHSIEYKYMYIKRERVQIIASIMGEEVNNRKYG